MAENPEPLLISPETISLVRDRIDMATVVQESVPTLKRRGRSWVGLCPFHKERSPSFHVNPERGFYKCFGCGESGDVFTFVMKEYGYTFTEAVRAMAERSGIEIEEDARERPEVDRAKKQRDDVYSANQLAAVWFEEQLRKHPQRSYALDELARRGIVPGKDAAIDDVLQAFRIGYAPGDWDGLATFFKQQGISPQVAELAGLLSPRSSGSGHYDRFRHRLMFSVVDTQGRVVAFSGRALEDLPPRPGVPPQDEKPAKYINSKETPVYTKGNLLFGLFQARHAIRREGVAIVVEGNFDVFSLHARGIANVVAPLGTAFTPEQAALLKRYAPTLVLLFDGDAAGKKAVRSSRDACAKAGLLAKVGVLPEGMDPDDFARKEGPAALNEIVGNAKGLLEFLIEAELDRSFVAADAREKLARVDAVAELVASEADPLVRMEIRRYADMLAGRLDIHGHDALRTLEQKIRATVRRAGPQDTSMFARSTPNPARFGDVEGAGGSDAREADPEDAPPRSQERRERTSAPSPKIPGAEHRRAIVGALLEYPPLLDDEEVVGVIAMLAGPAALAVGALRRAWNGNASGEKALDTAAFLAQIPSPIRPFAAERLAAPVHDSEREAKEALLDSASKLERLLLAHEGNEIQRELRTESVSDLRAMQERANRINAALSEQQRRGSANARVIKPGAASHEERPVEEATTQGPLGGAGRAQDEPKDGTRDEVEDRDDQGERGDGEEWRGLANDGEG